MIDYIVTLQKRFSRLYRSSDLISITSEYVHMRDVRLLASKFDLEITETLRGKDDEYPFELSVVYKEVKFISLHESL